ncbi:hypothetical protein L596_000264 [Steinernema carpocapsae]|uniref:Chromo domain-containing protein n=1 Tax=Steinernema carpocapsae TaxID=34508 RepID=A0A4U8UJV6_STECR|nr:hypothetical protein L596_000264 [Steinernema carpocapsae]
MPRILKRKPLANGESSSGPSTKTKKTKPQKKSKKNKDIYQVERLIDSRKSKAGQEFLVKWQGYAEPTWEPRKNILDYNLVKEFNTMTAFKKWRRETARQNPSKLDKNTKIEKILAVRMEDGKKELLVKFEGSSEYEVHTVERVMKKNKTIVAKFLDENDLEESADEA